MGSSAADESRSEIAFFDVETTVPSRPGQGHAILEFGAILVCSRKLVELQNYSTLVRPSDLSLISSLSIRCNGITPDSVSSAPTFADIAEDVYNILHGRIWAGHNILRFDCARIREAFAGIGRPAPEPKGTIDSLALLTQRFGRRAGDMKMASLATYFGLGQQKHRSLDDVRLNLEVVKYCATVLFLESSLPDMFPANSWVSPNATTRSRSNGKISPTSSRINIDTPQLEQTSEGAISSPSSVNQRIEYNHPIASLMTSGCEEVAESDPDRKADPDSFNMGTLCHQIEDELDRLNAAAEEESTNQSPCSVTSQPLPSSEGSSGSAGLLEPEQVSIPLISASLVPHYRGTHRMRLLHDGVAFQLSCYGLKVRLRVIRSQYDDYAGKPKFSFVVDISPALCQILEACEETVQKLTVESESISEWSEVVNRKNGSFAPTVRLHIPTVITEEPRFETEIYKRGSSGAMEKLVFSQCHEDELKPIIDYRTIVDAQVSLEPYDFHGKAGIRLVAKKLFVHSD